VLIAVAILAVTMVAVLELHASTVSVVAKAEMMSTAARLANNRMVDLLKDGLPSPGLNEGQFEAPDDRFTWLERTTDTPYSTNRVKVYEVTVEVAWGKEANQRIQLRTYRVQ
jgi:hypothetical protein